VGDWWPGGLLLILASWDLDPLCVPTAPLVDSPWIIGATGGTTAGVQCLVGAGYPLASTVPCTICLGSFYGFIALDVSHSSFRLRRVFSL
jgi:hypothetical protein